MEDKSKMSKFKFGQSNKINIKPFSIKVAATLALAISFIGAQAAFAAGDAGGGNNLGGSCYGSGTSWNSSCYGATWRYYPFGSQSQTFVNGVWDSNNQNVNGNANAPGGSIASGSGTGTGCEEVGGVYILGLEQYNPQNQESLGYQFGIVQSGQLATQGGYINFRDDIPGTSSLSTVQNAFNTAKAAGVTGDQNWDDTLGWFCYNPELEGQVPDEPETPPVAQLDADIIAKFWTTSGVETVPDDEVSQFNAETSGSRTGLKARIKFSTDNSSAQVIFTHKIYHAGSSGPAYPGVDYKKDENPPSSPLCVTGTVSGEAGGASAQHCDSDNTTTVTIPYTISIGEGEQVEVCSTISISAQLMGYKATAKSRQVASGTDSNGNTTYRTEKYNSWSGPLSAGSFQSEACARVERPVNPAERSTKSDPIIRQAIDNSITYAGETANPSWDSQMTSWPTRRYVGFDAVVYQINVQAQESNKSYYTKEAKKQRGIGSVCDYFGPKTYVKNRCVAMASDRSGPYGPIKTTAGYPISKVGIVPDQVGDKYCNSYGFQIRYFHATDNGETGDRWTPEPEKDYWSIYRSSCRTIAKKPTIAVWNGSIYTRGSITGITSPRYIGRPFGSTVDGGNGFEDYRQYWSNHFGFGNESNDILDQYLEDAYAQNSARTTFGSWAEYLLNINKRVSSFASAASFARDSGSDDASRNSTLTIANTDSQNLGDSGVAADSTFRNRLIQYFYNNESAISYSDAKAQGILNEHIVDSYIIKSDSDEPITIDSNIKLEEGGTYKSIYELPQVVIYSKGDINITSNVTRIDAWLISENGKINTCIESGTNQGFDSNETSADASDVAANRRPYRSDICTNQLMINGPVIADGMITKRSYGSDPDERGEFGGNNMPANAYNGDYMARYTPAEIFNLRADNYLWAYAQAGRYDSSYTEAYTRELAPRY